MPSVLDEIICACLARVYVDHATRTDRLTCKLEHALPIRHSFFRLKRVPHFQTRDDLHSQHTPAYLPIYRLENASLESLSQKTKAGCRRVLIEGDLGTGKTLVCQRLLHEWAKAMQFFRHVNIDQPYITVAGEQEESARMHHKKDKVHKSQTCDTEASLAKLTNDSAQTVGKQYSSQAISDQIQRRQRRPWNLGAIGGDTPSGHLPEKDSNINLKANPKCKNNFPNKTVTKATTLYEELTDEMLTQEDYVGREMPTQEDYVGREMPTQEDYVGREMPTQEDYVGREMLTQTKIVGEDDHRSRKALFVQPIVLEQTSPCGSDRTDSRSKANSRKESRSRSSGELEKGNLKKKNNKAFDGIPQKYLSLLNMGSGGEGSFESPSRSKSVREARRQRPSRLTSNLTDYKAMIYIPCVRMSLSDLLTKCNNARVRHYYVAATVLLDLLTLSNVPHQPVPFDAVYHWVLANREDICVIFDNVDGSETWERLISDAFHDRDGFGKMIAATTPGRISKRDVDTLFYCYGLSTEYSNKILLSRLRTEAPQLIDRISFLLTSNHTQELLCNPLSLSLLAAYLRSVTVDDNIPEHLSELLENLIHHAMAHETNTGQNVSKGKRQRFSLQGVCETVAFECLENDTNYFSKQKFPQQFWMRHLCDCRVLHEVHEIANFASIHEKASSPPPNILITPDSDSVHSSTSSSFEVNLSSDLCASNQSLSSVDPDSSRSDTDGVSSRAALSSGILLQVPNIHNSTDNAKKNAERPKSLALDGRKSSQGKSLQTTQTSGEIVSFTSRCIRDFLASKRVCRYLQSDRDCESFIQRLIAKPQFYPVLRLTVRHLYISERSDLILNLLDMLLTSQELGFQDHFNLSASQSPRGPSPTTFGEPAIRVKIPHRYRVSNSDCPFRAKREDLKQRRSSTSILGTCFESSATLNTSPSFNRLLINTSSLSPFSTTPSPEATRG